MIKRSTFFLVITIVIFIATGVALFQFINLSPVDAKTNTIPVSSDSLAAVPLIDLENNEHLLGDWKQPVIIVNFWAPWCIPCRDEIPALVDIQRQFADQVQILGLAFDSIENIHAFTAEQMMNYPSFLAGNQIPMYSAAFNNKAGGLPFTAFIDKERKLRYIHTGKLSVEQLRQKITELL